MCARSEAKLSGEDVKLYLGDYGGKLWVGDLTYKQGGEKLGTITRETLVRVLESYTQKELAEMIVELVDNSMEG